MHPKNLLILGVESFLGNSHDSKTIAPLLSQMQQNLGYQPEEVVHCTDQWNPHRNPRQEEGFPLSEKQEKKEV